MTYDSIAVLEYETEDGRQPSANGWQSCEIGTPRNASMPAWRECDLAMSAMPGRSAGASAN